MSEPTDAEIDAAARQLYKEGLFCHWWPESVTSYDSLDPTGKNEFDAVVERVLKAAAAVRNAR